MVSELIWPKVSDAGRYLDNKRFVRLARGSLNETQHWLRRAYKRNLLSRAEVEKLKPVIAELGPSLNAYLKSIGTIQTKPLSTDY